MSEENKKIIIELDGWDWNWKRFDSIKDQIAKKLREQIPKEIDGILIRKATVHKKYLPGTEDDYIVGGKYHV